MQIPIKIIAVAFLLVLARSSLFAQDGKAPASTPDVQAILQRRIDVEKRGVGIVVGLIDGQGKRVVGYGELRKDGKTKPDGKTVFEIGSVSKVFTSLLLADMVKRGEVSLNDPAQKYLPPSVKLPKRNDREVTLLDLATHTSALPRLPTNFAPKDALNPYADYTVEQMYACLSKAQLIRDIGAQYEYSNLATGLLGHILALRAGSDFETLVKTRICQPLGMTDTMITFTPEARKRLATGHLKTLSATKNWDIPTLAGAGAIRSTTNDMLKFVEANMGLVKTPLDAAMAEQLVPRRSAGGPDSEIALGWHIIKKYGNETVWHNGETGGYHSFVGFDKQRGVGVVVLSNSANDIDDIGLHLLDARFPLKKTEPKKERVAIKIDPQILDAYVGDYEIVPTFVIAVTKEGDRLMLQATAQPKFEVFPESEKKFFLKVVDAQISFVKDDKGTVTQLILHQNGIDQTAKRRKK